MKLIEAVKLAKELEQVMYDLDTTILEVQDERQGVYDDRSEKWQESSKGQEYEEATDELDTCRQKAEDAIEEAIRNIRNIANI